MASINLGEIADIITGPFGSMLHKSDYRETGIPVIMPQDIGDRTLSLDSIARIGKQDAERLARYVTVENDIVYARRGDVEKHAFITADEAGALCGTGCLRVRVDERKADPLFVSFYLNRPESRMWIRLHAVGSNMPNINTDILSELPMELPDLEVQRKVGNLLRFIDAKIANNEKLMAELEETARLIYDYWFTQFDFPDENGRPYRSNGGTMVWSDELKREIPKGWSSGTLGDYLHLKKDTIIPAAAQVYEHYSIPAYDDEKYPSLDDGSSIESGKYRVEKGCILYSKLNPKFKRLWRPYCLTDNAICSTEFLVMQPNRASEQGFVLGVLHSDSFYSHMVSRATSSTGSRSRVDPEAAVGFTMPRPSDRLIERYENVAMPLYNQIQQLEIEGHELASLRNWLLPMLMNGQLVVE